ncbi:MAG: hydrolase [Deltaproteobacteria bacterium]|nr:hydrolase [Deltaproteobacteria bacterium]
MLIQDAEIQGEISQVRLRSGKITAIGPDLEPDPSESVMHARGGALLPGLQDHHIHLLALAAATESVPCGPPQINDQEALKRALKEHASNLQPAQWLRGVGYHESVNGELDRNRLDALIDSHPVRIQHRSGALWILNSRALAEITPASGIFPDGAEKDEQGRLTGRLYRADAWLRSQLGPRSLPPLSEVGQKLASFGVTGVCDATPANGQSELEAFARARASGALPQNLLLMGHTELPASPYPGIERGAVKYMLDENALPAEDDLIAQIKDAHGQGRGMAFHCVTRTELVIALNALERAGATAWDRIEHASITPPDLLDWLARLPIAVVTQPNFIFERGDAYTVSVESRDQPWLYRCAGFLHAGVPLAGGTDAPFGEPNPWAAMQAAVERRSASGTLLSLEEALSPEAALRLFQSPLGSPGRKSNSIQVGQPADLLLLKVPWSRARDRLDAADLQATWVDGQQIWNDGEELGQ